MELYWLDVIDYWGREVAAARITDKVAFANPDEVCKKCFQPMHRFRLGPYGITFEPGASIIPDFLEPSRGRKFIVSNRVKEAYDEAGFKGYVAWPVKVNPPVQRKRRQIIVAPYPPPEPLWDIYVPERVNILIAESTIDCTGVCNSCERKLYSIADYEGRFSLIVDRSTWNGCDFMQPHELNTSFITERVADLIVKNKFTNIKVTHVGRISD